MKHHLGSIIHFPALVSSICLFLMLSGACQKTQPLAERVNQSVDYSIFARDNLVAWCVVPFDKMQRSPYERANMLKALGFKKFAYDWRDHHLQEFPEEVAALNEQGIELTSVWWWIDGQGDKLLNDHNTKLLQYLDSLGISCDIWMSFDDRFFEGLDDSQKLDKAVEAVKVLHSLAAGVNAKLQLYNHGAWFGDPRNQVRIIEETGYSDIGIIYNFHHAHHQIEEFSQLLPVMLPYLNTVNINGMKAEGPKILTVGQGDRESKMLEELALSGFKGHVGIIGHLEEEDVEIVLKRNLEGLESLLQ
jgi:hypothetical protein